MYEYIILAEYLAFSEAHPERFMNPPEGGFTILLKEAEISEVEAYMSQKLQAKGLPTEWSRVGIAYQDQYGMILRDAVRFPGGALGTYIRFIGKVARAPLSYPAMKIMSSSFVVSIMQPVPGILKSQ